MHRIVFLFFCLACVGHARRVQTSLEQLHREHEEVDKVVDLEARTGKIREAVDGRAEDTTKDEGSDDMIELLKEDLKNVGRGVESSEDAHNEVGQVETAVNQDLKKAERAEVTEEHVTEPLVQEDVSKVFHQQAKNTSRMHSLDEESEDLSKVDTGATDVRIYIVTASGAIAVAALVKLMWRFCSAVSTKRSIKKLEGPQTLKVTIVKATNLKPSNVLVDEPYCRVMVVQKGTNETVTSTDPQLISTKSTKAIEGNLNPEWNEGFLITAWYEGHDLVFDIMDDHADGYGKEESRIVLASDQFYPSLYDGALTVDSETSSYLYVKVEYVGPTCKHPPSSDPTPTLSPLEERYDRGNVVLVSSVLSMVAAMVNTYAFYELGVLLSHQTGNICHLGRRVEASLVTQLANAFLCFGLGSAVAGFAKFDVENFLATRRSPGLAIAGSCVLLGTLIQWQSENQVVWSIGLLSFSQGMQNAISSSCKAMPLRTTHITGSLTDVGIFVGNRLRAYFDNTSTPNPWKPTLLVLSMAFFTAGGIIARLLLDYIGALTGVVPALVLLVSAGGGLLGPADAIASCRSRKELQQSGSADSMLGA